MDSVEFSLMHLPLTLNCSLFSLLSGHSVLCPDLHFVSPVVRLAGRRIWTWKDG